MGEHPFDRINKDYRASMASRYEAAYEEEKVTYLLKAVGLNGRKAAAALREADPKGALTFRAFNDAYPSFPVLLGASTLGGAKLHLDADCLLPALYNRFTAAPFVEAYEDFYEKAARRAGHRPVGLVFRRKGVRHGLMIYQADDPATALPLCEREMVMAYAGGDKKRRHWLVVRMFQKVVEGVHNRGHGWTPADG